MIELAKYSVSCGHIVASCILKKSVVQTYINIAPTMARHFGHPASLDIIFQNQLLRIRDHCNAQTTIQVESNDATIFCTSLVTVTI